MKFVRIILPFLTGITAALLNASIVSAASVRDTSMPINVYPDYAKGRLVGSWYELARSTSQLEHDCHGVTTEVDEREDTRLTLKIACHKQNVLGPVLNIDGILVELEPGIFILRFVRVRAFGDMPLMVIWQAEDDSIAVLGTPGGQFGWVWAKSPTIESFALNEAKEKLIDAGYTAQSIRPTKQAQ